MHINKIENLHVVKKELFVGIEDDFYAFKYSNQFEPNFVFAFQLSEVYKQYFNKLRKICDNSIFVEIQKACGFKESKNIKGLYEAINGLPVFYKLSDSKTKRKKYLYLLSLGERNKGIFLICMEAYCEVEIIADLMV